MTMARIKQILNERRIAYEQAHALAYERQKVKLAEKLDHANLIKNLEEASSARQERIEAGLVGNELTSSTSAAIPEQVRVSS